MEGVQEEEYFDSVEVDLEAPPLEPAEPTDPLGPDAEELDCAPPSPPKPLELDSGGKVKAGGAGKVSGSWNYTHAECVAVAWAAISASELGITDMEGLYGRLRDYYLPKATELARIGGWTDALSGASKKGKLLRS